MVNASNIEKDWNHIIKQNQKFKATLENKSEKTALLAIQGPKAIAAMQPFVSKSIKCPTTAIPPPLLQGSKTYWLQPQATSGKGGIEIYFDVAHAEKVWRAVMDAGAHFGILPVGLAARDTLRLEMGYCHMETKSTTKALP